MSSTAPRGWCPSIHRPMAAEDGFIVRVKPRLGRISAAAARGIADAVEAHTDGSIALTSRANLQLRGLAGSAVEPFARAMIACGVADADPAVERRRNIIVAPLCDIAHAVAHDLEMTLARAEDFAPPEKFGFAVDGAPPRLGATRADIELCAGVVSIAGARRGVVCDARTAPGVAMAAARAFLALGGTRRMRDLVAAIGEDRIYDAAGLVASRDVTPRVAAESWIGEATCITPPSGLLTAARLRDLADRAGDGWLHVTPWRGVMIAAASSVAPARAA